MRINHHLSNRAIVDHDTDAIAASHSLLLYTNLQNFVSSKWEMEFMRTKAEHLGGFLMVTRLKDFEIIQDSIFGGGESGIPVSLIRLRLIHFTAGSFTRKHIVCFLPAPNA